MQFTGVGLRVDALLDDVLATFPQEYDGRQRLAVGMSVRDPGLVLRFAVPSLINNFNYDGHPFQFTPPLPWSSPSDSITVSWKPREGIPAIGQTFFDTDCGFQLSVAEPVLVTAETYANLVGTYAAPGDTVEVWGTEFGWPDIHLFAQAPCVTLAVEPATWGQVKHRARTLE